LTIIELYQIVIKLARYIVSNIIAIFERGILSKPARTMTTYDLSVRDAVAVAARRGLPELQQKLKQKAAKDAAANPPRPVPR
jgi:hypothetical protein